MHVMNYEEILAAARKRNVIYEEFKSGELREIHFDGQDFVDYAGNYLLLIECDEEDCEDYNWIYRCWDGRPSEELRKQTPWKENPYE